jgi:hypothetical protein
MSDLVAQNNVCKMHAFKKQQLCYKARLTNINIIQEFANQRTRSSFFRVNADYTPSLRKKKQNLTFQIECLIIKHQT